MKTTDSPKPAPLVVALLMLAFSVMGYFNRTIMSISGPEIIKEFSLSETQMGSIYSAFILSYALLMIPGGHLADRLGPRIVIAFMGLGSALFTGLTAVAGHPGLGTWIGVVPSFLLVRLAMGACTAPLYPSCARMNANWFPLSQTSTRMGIDRGRSWNWRGSFTAPFFSNDQSLWLAHILLGVCRSDCPVSSRLAPEGSRSSDATQPML